MKHVRKTDLTTTSEEGDERLCSRSLNAAGEDTQWAFTLIELLVVISIIGLLSSVVLASLSGARESARDSRRVQDMRQVLTAIELYRNQNGFVPGNGNGCGSESTKLNKSSCLVDELRTVMNSVPTDPRSEDTDFYYAYDPIHNNTSQKCGGASAAVLGFNMSESGIAQDRDTTSGSDQNLDDAAYNRVICRE